jgi:lipopolysaccharide export system ATP-binding protein
MALLEVKALVKNYGRRRVVDGVNFDVNSGEVVGLLGPNGAGKTTSFRMTTGQVAPYSGKVIFNGGDVTRLPMFMRARLGMGYLSQETSVFRKLSVEQNILAILEMMPAARSLGRKLSRSERWDRTDTILDQFGLTHIRKNNAWRISGGEKRRLEIARCLVCEPLLILLDEPFTGIDPITIADIRQIVRQLSSQGIGVLLTDHNVREALKITDRSYLIKDGKVRTHGSPHEILHDPIAINEYLGQGFHEDILPGPPAQHKEISSRPRHSPTPKRDEPAPAPAKRNQEPRRPAAVTPDMVIALIDALKGKNRQEAAERLLRLGQAAIPPLLEALERRDVELRRQAHEVLQVLCKSPIAFDPYAPEAMRRQQLASLRDRWERKAG